MVFICVEEFLYHLNFNLLLVVVLLVCVCHYLSVQQQHNWCTWTACERFIPNALEIWYMKKIILYFSYMWITTRTKMIRVLNELLSIVLFGWIIIFELHGILFFYLLKFYNWCALMEKLGSLIFYCCIF